MKLCTITGSRAEFFILKNLILRLQKEKKFKHQLIVTGSHTSRKFGNTIRDIKRNKVKITSIIKTNFKGDKPNNITNYLADGIKKFSNKFSKTKPDLILVLGDRYEIYSAVIAAYLARISIAHIYGGETTQGSLDEGIRHSITKLSNIHLVSNKKHLNRVNQLGENKKYIFNIGSLGVEALIKHKDFSKLTLEKELKIKFNKKNVLMTFHSETTLSKEKNIKNLNILLNCLKKLKDTTIIITTPGADHFYKSIQSRLKNFNLRNKNVFLFKSLGDTYYFSICKNVDFMIGNSSSGIIEMPSLNKGTINVGNRQLGREQARSVINIKFSEVDIMNGIKKIYSKKFKKILKKVRNPYEKKNSLSNVIKILKALKIENLKSKKFCDLKIK